MLIFNRSSFGQFRCPQNISVKFANTSGTCGYFRFAICLIALVCFANFSALAGNGDTTPPSIPGKLTATVVGCSNVTLSWTASTDPNGPQSGMAGYKIYRNSVCIFTNGLTITFLDTTVSGNGSMSYQVSALDNSTNESPLSIAALVSPCPDVTAPAMPANLGASVASSSRVDLSWPSASDGLGKKYETVSGIKGYQIYRNGTDANSKIADVFGGSLNFSDTAAAPDSAVYYAIRTIDNNNNVSGFKLSATVTTPPLPPGSPTGLFVNVSDCKKAGLSWNPPSASGSGIAWYNIYRNGEYFAQTFFPSVDDTSVSASTVYSYSVSAVDTLGRESAQSQSFTVLTSVCPATPPRNVRIHLQGNHAIVQWDGSSDAQYQLECSPGFFGPWVPVDVPTRNLSITNLALQASSIYRVALFTNTPAYLANFAVNQTDKAAPPAPQNLGIEVISETEASLTWDPVTDYGTVNAFGQLATSGLDRYVIYRDGVFLKSEPASAAQSTDTTVIAENTYTYGIAAVDKSGNLSSLTSNSVLMRKPCNYAIGSSTASFDSNGGSGSLSVTTGNNCSWAAAPSDIWIHSSSSGSGNGTISFTVDANDSVSPRSGTITVGGKIFSISQSGISCSYLISPTGMSHGAGAQGGSFNVSAGTGCSWAASSSFAWIHTGSSGNGNGAVNYTVDANTSIAGRSGSITVAGQTFSISQSGTQCNYSLSPTSLSHGSGAAGGSFNVTAPTGCSWAASTTYSWIHTSSSANGNGTVNYTIDANTGASSRSGTITVAGQSFTVIQAGVSCSYTVSPTSSSLGSGSGNGSFGVTAGTGCSWTASTASGWIHTTSSGNGNGTVSYTIDANTTISSRSATIVVAGQNFTVNQAGLPCTYVLSPLSLSHGSGADSGSFSVTSLLGCGWAASTGASWIHTTSSGNGNGNVNYTVDANGTSSARSDIIFVAGQSFTVYQAAGTTCSYSVSPTSSAYNSSGGSGTLTVTANAGCSWSATSDSGWLTVTSGTSGSGNGTVGYSVAVNTSTSSRSGNLTIAGQNINITQSGASGGPDTTAPSVAVTAPASGSVVAGSVQVTANATDNVGVSSVQFYVDNLGSWVLIGTLPGTGGSAYTEPFNTTNVANGAHNFLCRAYDVAGNSSYSMLGVTVSNYNADPGILTWAKDVGQSPLSGEVQSTSVKADSQGNQIMVGKFSGTVNFSGTTLTSQGGYDFYVAKFNSNGALTWVKTYGGSFDNVANSVAVDSADNIIVAGYFVGSMNLGGTTLVSGGGTTSPDMFLAKFNSAGTPSWSKRFGGAFGNYANGVAVDKNNDIFVTGQFNVSVDFGGGTVSSAGGTDGFVTKYSGQTGAYIWARGFGGTGYDISEGVGVDGNGDVIVSGYSTGSMDFGGGLRANNGGSDGFMAKFVGSTGGHIWSKMIGGPGNESADGVAIDPTGNGIFVGSFTQNLTIGGLTFSAPLSTAMLIGRFDTNGTIVWAKAVGGVSSIGGSVGPRAVAVDSAGNVAITGVVTGEADFGSGQIGSGTGNIFIAKYNSTGGYIWDKRFGSTGWSAGLGLAIDSSRNIFGSGSFAGTVTFDTVQLTTISPQIKDAYLIKISP
jgi:hypothetical protein